MNKNIKYTLENNGIDTDKYLSLRINKDDLPDGAEVVLAIMDADGKAKPIGHARRRSKIAVNSRFHNQIMADGYIFNPYSHRRYIAAQFKRLIKHYGFSGITDGIIKSFNWAYAIDILCKEVHKLKNLHKYDLDAFQERSQFFTLAACADILEDYADAVCAYLDNCLDRVTACDSIHIPGYGMVKRANFRPMKYRFTRLAAMARECSTYAKLDRLLEDFDWQELPKTAKLTTAFAKPFIEEGAYYTLKHDMMFEGLRMHNCDQQKSLKDLRNRGSNYLDLASWLLWG